MPYHEWGDLDFDFGMLDVASRYLAKLYYKCTGKHMIYKEKYGTIRYECCYTWMPTIRENRIFVECLKRTIRKFPFLAGELSEDASYCPSYYLSHYKTDEFFRGITWYYDILFPDTNERNPF